MHVPWKGIIAATVVGALFTLQGYTLTEQQNALEGLLTIAQKQLEVDKDTHTKLWDLHRRVLKLEAADRGFAEQDHRLMAHIRWFVMRRSGTDELKRMEAAIKTLEARGD